MRNISSAAAFSRSFTKAFSLSVLNISAGDGGPAVCFLTGWRETGRAPGCQAVVPSAAAAACGSTLIHGAEAGGRSPSASSDLRHTPEPLRHVALRLGDPFVLVGVQQVHVVAVLADGVLDPGHVQPADDHAKELGGGRREKGK
ncbi:hypothetical protein EYF80_037162 [Liparis tanakae]|uniref:Uncharacterized protein n=1 Tax=Liparis tanakae TaxID=230148 RepID=A0A4Z2GIW4_9TELE|nr:hypothetical protein EYF80_037162 [Liparis tanakae]